VVVIGVGDPLCFTDLYVTVSVWKSVDLGQSRSIAEEV